MWYLHLPVLVPWVGMLSPSPILLLAPVLSIQWLLVLLDHHFGASLISQHPVQDPLLSSISVHCASTTACILDPSHISMCSGPPLLWGAPWEVPVLSPVLGPLQVFAVLGLRLYLQGGYILSAFFLFPPPSLPVKVPGRSGSWASKHFISTGQCCPWQSMEVSTVLGGGLVTGDF